MPETAVAAPDERPILELVRAAAGADGARPADVQALGERLAAFDCAPSLAARLDSWAELIEWQRGDSPGGRLERLLLMLRVLERSRALHERFLAALSAILEHTDAVGVFGAAGLPGHRGFTAELADRVTARLLPAPRDDHDLARLLRRTFGGERDPELFRRVSPEHFARLVALLAPPERKEIWADVRLSFGDGFLLLATRVQAEGLSEKVRVRGRERSVSASPFLRLQRASEDVAQAWKRGEDLESLAIAWRRACGACREETAAISRGLETEGVSVDIVYSLEVLQRALARMELMLDVMTAPRGELRAGAVQQLLARLLLGLREDSSVAHLMRATTRRLHQKIVERSGETGEHYVARSRRAYWLIWAAAAGGGLVTVFTAAFKLSIHELHLAPFLEGLGFGLNYAASFLLMQRLGFVLATKQPAVTAAALASILRDPRGERRLDEVVDFAAAIVRSQLAATVANVCVVSVGAIGFAYLWRALFATPFLEPEHARAVYDTLSPLNSGTVFYAALTGVILWAASLIGGWFDNWAVYRRLPLAIAEHRLGARLGRERMARWGERVRHGIGDWATSVSLGLMLGMTPALGTFFGLPLDVRHVTLSTGTLALATGALDQHWWGDGRFARASAGVATMFVLNLGVSFLLSVFTAVRAFDLPRRDALELFARMARRFVRRPGEFLLPPRD